MPWQVPLLCADASRTAMVHAAVQGGRTQSRQQSRLRGAETSRNPGSSSLHALRDR